MTDIRLDTRPHHTSIAYQLTECRKQARICIFLNLTIRYLTKQMTSNIRMNSLKYEPRKHQFFYSLHTIDYVRITSSSTNRLWENLKNTKYIFLVAAKIWDKLECKLKKNTTRINLSSCQLWIWGLPHLRG